MAEPPISELIYKTTFNYESYIIKLSKVPILGGQMVDSQKPLCESIIHEMDRQLLSFFHNQLKQEIICNQFDQNMVGYKDSNPASFIMANKELPIYLPLIDHSDHQVEREHKGQQRIKDPQAPPDKEHKNEASDGSVRRQDSYGGSSTQRNDRSQRDQQHSAAEKSVNDTKSNASKLLNFQLRNRLNEFLELQQ